MSDALELYDEAQRLYRIMLDVRAKESAYPSKVRAAEEAWHEAHAAMVEGSEPGLVREALQARATATRKRGKRA